MAKKVNELKSLEVSVSFISTEDQGHVLIGFPSEEGIKPVSRTIVHEEDVPSNGFPQGELLEKLAEVLESAAEELKANYWRWVEAETAKQERKRKKTTAAPASSPKTKKKKAKQPTQQNFLEAA